jgi:uncharacterized protein YfaS (alpha-2-macroglobulin family)
MSQTLFDIGERVRVRAVFADSETGLPFDPVVVKFTVLAPDGVKLPYTYPTAIVQLAIGDYVLDIPSTMRGRYWVEVEGEGTVGKEVEATYFNVKRSIVQAAP